MTAAVHEVLLAPPAQVIDRLPAMGRVMTVLRAGGATHERIGPIEAVLQDEGRAYLTGACHAARLDLACIARMALDRSGVMQGRAFPRLTFHDAKGQPILAVVGLEGLDAFDAALSGLATRADAPAPVDRPNRPEATEEDPALAPLVALAASGAPVTIAAHGPGVAQSWQGVVSAVKPAMGFFNVMSADFHLHLAAGSVHLWRAEFGLRHAVDMNGQAMGLTLESEIFA